MIEMTIGNGHGFLLKSEGGQILLSSVLFTDKAICKKIARQLCEKGLETYGFERKTNHEGKFLFNLKNNDGDLIGQSQLYSSEAGMENGINNLKKRVATLKYPDAL